MFILGDIVVTIRKKWCWINDGMEPNKGLDRYPSGFLGSRKGGLGLERLSVITSLHTHHWRAAADQWARPSQMLPR